MTRRFETRSIHARSFTRSARRPVRWRSAFVSRRRRASFRPTRSTTTKNAERSARTVETPSGGSGRGVTNRSRVLSWSAWSGRGNLLLFGFGRNRSIGGGEGGRGRTNLNEARHRREHAAHVGIGNGVGVLRARDDHRTYEVRASPHDIRRRFFHEVDSLEEKDRGGEREATLSGGYRAVCAQKARLDAVLRERTLEPLKRCREQRRVGAREV